MFCWIHVPCFSSFFFLLIIDWLICVSEIPVTMLILTIDLLPLNQVQLGKHQSVCNVVNFLSFFLNISGYIVAGRYLMKNPSYLWKKLRAKERTRQNCESRFRLYWNNILNMIQKNIMILISYQPRDLLFHDIKNTVIKNLIWLERKFRKFFSLYANYNRIHQMNGFSNV